MQRPKGTGTPLSHSQRFIPVRGASVQLLGRDIGINSYLVLTHLVPKDLVLCIPLIKATKCLVPSYFPQIKLLSTFELLSSIPPEITETGGHATPTRPPHDYQRHPQADVDGPRVFTYA